MADDIEVQEVFEGQTSLLLPPKAKFKLSNSSPNCMSPMRSLTPCDAVPRPAFLRCVSDVNDAYKLRRPSSHYDAQAQAASSRPTSRQDHSCHTGKSFSEALILASTNPQYDDRLFMELP